MPPIPQATPPIIVIPCGGAKLSVPAKAGSLYTGLYHRSCLGYARSLAPDSEIFILSAKYGLLDLNEWISPYNLSLGEPGSVTAVQVADQAEAKGIAQRRCIALGGKKYVAICRKIWKRIITPLDGVGGIGKQIQWLQRKTRGISPGPKLSKAKAKIDYSFSMALRPAAVIS